MSRSDVVDAVRAFHALRQGSPDACRFHQSVLKNGKKFIALIDVAEVQFLPGYYALASRQITDLDQRQISAKIAVVDRKLKEICGRPLIATTPLYSQIDAAYCDYCRDSETVPSAHHQERTYWLLRPA